MARITVEDCLEKVNNRFALVRLASRRAKQLLRGSQPAANTRGNREIVSALREIAAGKVRFNKRIESQLRPASEPVGTAAPDQSLPESSPQSTPPTKLS